MKHIKLFESMRDSSRFDKAYLDEVTKRNILTDMENISKLVGTLTRAFSNEKGNLDNETKKKILILQDMVSDIYDTEMNKMIIKQKKNGKEFITNKEIDDLIDNIKNEK
jgi:hypothetical protein